MERQYIFFKSARGLLVFAAGMAGIVASIEIVHSLFPEAEKLLAAGVVCLTFIVVIASFRADKQSRSRSKHGKIESERRRKS